MQLLPGKNVFFVVASSVIPQMSMICSPVFPFINIPNIACNHSFDTSIVTLLSNFSLHTSICICIFASGVGAVRRREEGSPLCFYHLVCLSLVLPCTLVLPVSPSCFSALSLLFHLHRCSAPSLFSCSRGCYSMASYTPP